MFDTDIKLDHIIEQNVLQELLNSLAEKYHITIGAYNNHFSREYLASLEFKDTNTPKAKQCIKQLESPLSDLHNQSILNDGMSLYFQSKHIEYALVPIHYQDKLIMTLGLALIDPDMLKKITPDIESGHGLLPVNSPSLELIEPIDHAKKEISLFVEAGCQRYKLSLKNHENEYIETYDLDQETRDNIIFTNPDHIIMDATPAACTILGSPNSNLIGLNVHDLLTSLAIEEKITKPDFNESQSNIIIDLKIPQDNNSLAQIKVKIIPQKLGEITLGYEYHLTITDILSQANTTEEGPAPKEHETIVPLKADSDPTPLDVSPLLVSAQELALFNAIPRPLVIIDEKHLVKIWNREIAAMLDMNAASVIGTNFVDLLDKASRQKWTEISQQINAAGNQETLPEIPLSLQTSNHQAYHAKVSLGISRINEQNYYIIIFNFWSQHQEDNSLSKEINKTTQKAIPSGSHINKTDKLDLLQQAFNGFTQHMEMLSGELYQNTSTILMDENTNGEIRPKLENIKSIAKKISFLKQNLYYFSSREEPHFDKINLNEKIGKWSENLKNLVGPVISIQLNLQDNLGQMQANSKQLKHALKTLVMNAAESYSGNGNIIIHTRQHDVEASKPLNLPNTRDRIFIVLEVIDSGQGIPVKIREKLFEPFITNKPHEIGRGLGLPSVYGIMKSHNGFITVKSLDQQGTIVSLFFPVIKESNNNGPSEQSIISKQKILLIDDDPGIIEVNSITLRHFGFETLSAETAKQGLKVYRENHQELSLVIQDISLPDMEGIDCAEKLKKIYAKVPLILSSGYHCNDVYYEFMQRTGSIFLQKPYTSNKLYQTIQSVLTHK